MYSVKLADIYDATYHFKDYSKDVGYLLAQMREHHPSARTLLETACGTGMHLSHMHTAFAHVEGLDLSGEMLEKARCRLPGIPFHQADMTAFDLGRQFDVVCCLFRSIGYVKTRERLFEAVAAMARHVAPGGILMIEPFFTPETYWVNKVTLNECRQDDLTISWMYVSQRFDRVARFDIHYLVGTPRGVRHFKERHEFGLFDRRDYEDAFAAAGFELAHDPQGPTGVGLYIGRHAGAATNAVAA